METDDYINNINNINNTNLNEIIKEVETDDLLLFQNLESKNNNNLTDKMAIYDYKNNNLNLN